MIRRTIQCGGFMWDDNNSFVQSIISTLLKSPVSEQRKKSGGKKKDFPNPKNDNKGFLQKEPMAKKLLFFNIFLWFLFS